jgi:hypothetical protein
VLHGFGSATVVNDVAEQSLDLPDGKRFVALYLGDRDPSGLYMSEVDLPQRLARYGGVVQVDRLALTPQDAAGTGEGGVLPSFHAADKRTDSRYGWFVARYGHTCWELDALPPPALRARVARAVWELLDAAAWDRAEAVEAIEHASLSEMVSRWTDTLRGQPW